MSTNKLGLDRRNETKRDDVRLNHADIMGGENEPRAGADASRLDQDQIMLGVLSAVDRNSQISQRAISSDLGVALGLANAYLKRCVRKGWIKVQQVPRRRYAYYLTPQGFAEKTRLAGEYLTSSFTYFRRARGQVSDLIGVCIERGWTRIAYAGLSDLAEIGFICSHDYPVEVVGFVDPGRAGNRFCGLPVMATVAELGPVDVIIITGLDKPDAIYRSIVQQTETDRVLVPRLLRVALPKDTDFNTLSRAAE